MNKSRVVVNADDFGMNSKSTNAIIKSFEMNWISTTTIIPTMPGFEEACEIAHEKKLLDRIGIHFNLTEGQPLTEKIKTCPRFYNDRNELYKSYKGNFFTSDEIKAIYTELEAQLKRLHEFKISPTHADSHHHVHHHWGIGLVFSDFCKRNNIPSLRLSFNYGKKFGWKRKLYSKLFNGNLKLKRIDKTKYFCEIRQSTPELFAKNKPVEVMVHPIYDDHGNITNYASGDDFEYLVNKYLSEQTLITFKELS
ncbi:MAG: ChbG/HpnK family deacetylase [Ignavibacteria bacterium]|nr:ChbG/HpnK family deacetylase [Ignavibacteria bacterium]